MMRKLLFVLCLMPLAVTAFSAPVLLEGRPEAIYQRFAELQAEARQVATACGGDDAVAVIYRQIDEWVARLPREREPALDQGGDDCSTAELITTLPYCDHGSTLEATDTYTPPCDPTGTAPDVVYRFTPATNMTVSISLCGSAFNTVLHIYQQCPDVPGILVCCNDDLCGVQSCCPVVNLQASRNYYIVVDGAGTDRGDYTLNIGPQGACGNEPCPPCSVSCPSGAIAEGEGCPPGFPDNYNAGCYWFPFAATTLDCGETKCGSSYWDTAYQDHDAYIVTIHARDSLIWCMSAEFDFQMDVHQFFSAG
jgi:hypothetical protein